MHRVLADAADLIGKAAVRGELHPVGPHFALIPRDDSSALVEGELYEIRPAAAQDLLKTLDAYEGIGDPANDQYRREVAIATLADGRECRTWVYVLKR